jgi:hypothetical protein
MTQASAFPIEVVWVDEEGEREKRMERVRLEVHNHKLDEQ